MLKSNPGLLAGGVFLNSEIPMTSAFKVASTLAVGFSPGIWLFCCSVPGFLSQNAGTQHGAMLGNGAWLCSLYSMVLCLMKLQLSCESEPTPKLIDLWGGKITAPWCCGASSQTLSRQRGMILRTLSPIEKWLLGCFSAVTCPGHFADPFLLFSFLQRTGKFPHFYEHLNVKVVLK